MSIKLSKSTAREAKAVTLPQVNFSEDGEVRYLHLGSEWGSGLDVAG